MLLEKALVAEDVSLAEAAEFLLRRHLREVRNEAHLPALLD